jgi:hypothetical protein
MSGAAGHIRSPWEDGGLTFGQIRKIIVEAFSGTLKNAKEKLDGVNILMTYKGGHVYIARTPKQIRNNGAEAIRWDLVGDYMKTPESREAYSTAAEDLQTILFPINEEILREFFCDGKYWLNMELLTPLMENIIHYGKSQLRIHNVQTEDGIVDREDLLYPFLELVYLAQKEMNHTFEVGRTNRVSFRVMDPQRYLDELDSFMADLSLVEGNTLNDFLAAEFWEFIDFEFSKIGEEDFELRKGLIRRWAYSDKSRNITKLLSGRNPKLVQWVKETDPTVDDKRTEFLEPIIELFSKAGSFVLVNLADIASSDQDKTRKSIITKATEGINKMKEYRGEKSKFLKTQYERFLRTGGVNSIAPTEGIVFEFEGKLFKLTGSYLPLLKIISFFRFGRDK